MTSAGHPDDGGPGPPAVLARYYGAFVRDVRTSLGLVEPAPGSHDHAPVVQLAELERDIRSPRLISKVA